MDALLSIKPEFANKIFTGEKLFEYRKAIFKHKVRKIIVYSTKPVGMIIGEFDIVDILEEDPRHLWEMTKDNAGIEKDYFLEYFKGRKKGYAIRVGEYRLYDEPYDPTLEDDSFFPPQSFRYVNKQLSLF